MVRTVTASAAGSVPVPRTTRSKPSPSTSAAACNEGAAVPREGQAATVAAPPGDVDVPVSGQSGDHPRDRRLAGAEPLGQVALGHPVAVGHVQQHQEARVAELAGRALEQGVGPAVHERDKEVQVVGEGRHTQRLADATCSVKVL